MKANWMENYLQQDMNLHGGHFYYFDRVQKRLLALQPEALRKPSRVMKSADHEFSACVAMRSDSGEKYNLDLIMAENGSCPQIKGIAVHTAEGIPRYRWSKMGKNLYKQRPFWEQPKSSH